jgi:RNA polymerase sigma factor (sigma-70 family)
MRPLRAYLLIRLPSDDVDVSTHRDLESVESAWRERLYPEASAALHVGFWRPETEDFMEPLREHPGRVLVSASAVHALPSSFRSSSAPVGSAGSLPLHLALTGWGYEIEDTSVSTATTRSLSSPPVRPTPMAPGEPPDVRCEWLRILSQESPAMFQEAIGEGVVDEDSYLAKEESLPSWLRDSLGEARFRWHCPTPPTAENIIDLIAFTPLWFQSLPIGILTFSTRPANIMSAKSIRVIGDFRRYKAYEVFAFENMGRKSFSEIGNRLLSVLSSGVTSPIVRAYLNNEVPVIGERDDQWKKVPPPASSTAGESREGASRRVENGKIAEHATTFAEALKVAFGLLTEQERRLMEMRMGADRDPMTLLEIGEANGVSRERIRQIESKCVRKIRTLSFWDGVLGPKIRRMLEERDDYLAPHGLEVMDPALKGAAKSIGVLEYALERFVEPELHVVKEGGLCFVTEIRQQEWLDAVRAARKLLETLAEKRTPIEEARNMVDGLIVGRGRELRAELWNTAAKNAHFANGKLVAYGFGAENVVQAVLESSETPMHYSEILRVTQEKGYDYDLRRVHSAAAEVGLLYGRGTYGTMRHFPLNEAETRLVVSETEDLIEWEGATRQWHAREICDRLEERGIDCGGNLTHYVVSIAMSRSKHLTYLGRMVWASKSSGAKGVANRLDMHQAVVSILIENGKPMLSDEIKARLAAERGVNCFFQIQPEGRLVRVGTGAWGLIERDIPFSPDETNRVIGALCIALQAMGKGIHSSEIINEIAKIEPIARRVHDPILLLGLAQKFEKLSLSKGQYVYLSEWGEPRRMTINEALIQVFKVAGREGVTIQEGIERASHLLERPFPHDVQFGQRSWQLGAMYDESTKRWRMPSEDESLPETECE